MMKNSGEEEEEFMKEAVAVYLSVNSDVKEDVTSPDELMLLLQHAGRNPSKATLDKYWSKDTDSYTFKQFCSILRQEKKSSKDDLMKAFQTIDTNGDGYITHEELYKVLTKRGERMTKAEVREMIDDADFNNDGKLSYDEFC